MLAETADTQIISTVHRKLAQRYHPDLDSSSEAARHMADLNEAYAVLRDPRNAPGTTHGWPVGATGDSTTG